ncbi:hypothetical protein C8R45DRAFT_981507 [Mycena sanguinolenta]|nr:hypothetical protein C8R45DRAFT_981507 [Mycena sanguinolenta]
MATVKDTRAGFGRRNNDDSSSSRESSPVRKQKRSFTPTSDDEVVIEPVADNDTPPPEGPLIRQALAFNWTPSIPTAPASINMYQATPLPAPTNKFLPGQVVPTPPPPPKPRKVKKKKTAPRYSSQTGRFRVDAYDPTTPAEPAPPLTKGAGPYTSIYRAETAPNKSSAREPSEGTSSGSRKKPKPSQSGPKASTSTAKVTASNPKSSASTGKTSDPKQGSTSTPGPSNMTLQSSIEGDAELSQGSYYRHDYDEQNIDNSVAARSPSPRIELRHSRVNQPQQLRLVTVLIADKRGDEVDNLLVEVRVTLRDSDDPKADGYWAQARDICRSLQTSPSRIDGPAKLFTLRGKYRQLILKVTADNQDEYVEANVNVDPLRTLEVVVETGPSALPRMDPPPISREPSTYMPPPAGVQYPYTPPEQVYPGRKRRRQSPDEDHRRPSSRQWSASTLASPPRGTPPRSSGFYPKSPFNAGSPDVRMPFMSQQPIPGPSRREYSPPRYADPSSETRSHSESGDSISSESEDADAGFRRVSQEVDQLIQQQEDEAWNAYFRSTAKQRTCVVMLKEYQIVQGLVDRWVGKQVPSGALIEKSHIGQALLIEDPNPTERDKYLADCTETLELMALYGPEGRRLQDPDVVAKAADDSIPEYTNPKPVRGLLKMLRRVHQQWIAAHPAT